MDRSDSSHAILDKQSRRIKANKIIKVLEQYSGSIKNKTILDIGTGAGYISHHIGKRAKLVYSVDVVDERREKLNYKFKKVTSEKLPFEDNFFDIVISNHVIEHVNDQKKHLAEASRVLKKGGIIYLATPNKYWLTDPHYKLLFISWLHPKLSTKYLKLVKNKDWDINPLSRKSIKKLSQPGFEINDATIDMVKHPENYHLDTFRTVQPVTSKIPSPLVSATSFFMPTLILVLKKV